MEKRFHASSDLGYSDSLEFNIIFQKEVVLYMMTIKNDIGSVLSCSPWRIMKM